MCKIRFITIGYIEWRKGQDLLVDAIKRLPSEMIDITEFIFVGQNTSRLAGQLLEKTKDLPDISVLGILSRENVHNLLDSIDVMICPSREDPMPTVCAEAMMHCVPCLVSDAIGTAEYIKDGYDGLIFHSEDVEELKLKIMWCIEHRDMLKEIGQRSHMIFEKVFSQDAFEKNLIMYVEDMIGKAKP